jgi:hypothetical protein
MIQILSILLICQNSLGTSKEKELKGNSKSKKLEKVTKKEDSLEAECRSTPLNQLILTIEISPKNKSLPLQEFPNKFLIK